MRTLLRPRWVYRGGGRVETGTSLLVDGGTVTSLPAATDAGIDAERVELPRHLVLPGLVNAHTHAGAGPVARGIAEDLKLAPGTPYYVPLTRLWQLAYQPELREGLRAIVRWDLLGMLRTGTTTVVSTSSVDIEGYLDAAEDVGVRTWAGPALPMNVAHRLGTLDGDRQRREDLSPEREQLAELDAFRALHAAHDGRAGGRIRLLLGPASAHTVEPAVLAGLAKLAAELDCPVTTHLCQSEGELAEVRRKFDRTPVELLDEAGLLGERLICAHGTYLPDADLPRLAASGAVVAHCAVRKVREAILPPFGRFAEAGVRMAIGTDAFTTDLVTEVRMAAMLAKIAVGRTDWPDAATMLDAAVTGPAPALGLRADLTDGAAADLVAVELAAPESAPVFDPLASVVHYASGHDVDLVMVGGEIRVRDRQLVGVDWAAARAAAEDACAAVWQRWS
ncbi:amidohydrolase family protein [Dactylosporangium sp. NPDC000244]|uniref:amidohydrolase family protein n=1 Tax=Dactylosporangium sp. NPDC000244 TaxID=3154365 RepID=UPI0033182152